MKKIMSLFICLCLLCGCSHKTSTNNNDELRLYEHQHYQYKVPYTWSERETPDNPNLWYYYHETGMMTIQFSPGEHYDYTKKMLQKQLIKSVEYHNGRDYIDISDDITTFNYDYISGFKAPLKSVIDQDQYEGYFAGLLYEQDNISIMLLYSDHQTDYSQLMDTMIQSIKYDESQEDTEIPQEDDSSTIDLPEDTNTTDESTTQDDSSTNNSDTQQEERTGIDPSFKKLMDTYEKFFDDYISFMKNYQSTDDIFSMLGEYTVYLTEYAKTMQALDDIDTSKLTKEEYAYYTEVTGRITQKLLKLMQ